MSHDLGYGLPQPPQLLPNPFNSPPRNKSLGSPPHSELAERFRQELNQTSPSASANVPKEFHDQRVKILTDVVELQAWALKNSGSILRSVNKQVLQCMENLEKIALKER